MENNSKFILPDQETHLQINTKSLAFLYLSQNSCIFSQQCQIKFNPLFCKSLNASYQSDVCADCCTDPHLNLQLQHCSLRFLLFKWMWLVFLVNLNFISWLLAKYQEIFLSLKYSTVATKDVAPAKKKSKAHEVRFLIHINCIRKHTFFTQDSHSLLNQ